LTTQKRKYANDKHTQNKRTTRADRRIKSKNKRVGKLNAKNK
jgi:hypothetical protein